MKKSRHCAIDRRRIDGSRPNSHLRLHPRHRHDGAAFRLFREPEGAGARKLELEARIEEAKAEQLRFSNGDYAKMEERVRVLERIATDNNHALASQIEELRMLDNAAIGSQMAEPIE